MQDWKANSARSISMSGAHSPDEMNSQQYTSTPPVQIFIPANIYTYCWQTPKGTFTNGTPHKTKACMPSERY